MLAVLAAAVLLSVNLLFKVTAFRIENFDRTTPADTGIYSGEDILNALQIEQDSNLFGFSTAAKAQQLSQALPYLDDRLREIFDRYERWLEERRNR